jgi:hypothetical protein
MTLKIKKLKRWFFCTHKVKRGGEQGSFCEAEGGTIIYSLETIDLLWCWVRLLWLRFLAYFCSLHSVKKFMT